MADPRPFAQLRDSGLLWLINRTVFHPRGFALGFVLRDGEAIGWTLQGDGTEPWTFTAPEDQHFQNAEATLQGRARGTDG